MNDEEELERQHDELTGQFAAKCFRIFENNMKNTNNDPADLVYLAEACVTAVLLVILALSGAVAFWVYS